jgi:hypothetical protein
VFAIKTASLYTTVLHFTKHADTHRHTSTQRVSPILNFQHLMFSDCVALKMKERREFFGPTKRSYEEHFDYAFFAAGLSRV